MLHGAQMQANQHEQQRGPTITMRTQQRQNNELLFEALLYQQLRNAFAQTNFTTPNTNPFPSRPFVARLQDGNGNEHGCSVSYQNPEAKFTLLTPTVGSLQALTQALDAHQRAYHQWKNQRSDQDEQVELICSLTVDSLEEIKPVLQALSQHCQIHEFYLRDPNDPTKTSTISLDMIRTIQNEIVQEQHRGTASQAQQRQSSQQQHAPQQPAATTMPTHPGGGERRRHQPATTQATRNATTIQPQEEPEIIVRDRPRRAR